MNSSSFKLLLIVWLYLSCVTDGTIYGQIGTYEPDTIEYYCPRPAYFNEKLTAVYNQYNDPLDTLLCQFEEILNRLENPGSCPTKKAWDMMHEELKYIQHCVYMLEAQRADSIQLYEKFFRHILNQLIEEEAYFLISHHRLTVLVSVNTVLYCQKPMKDYTAELLSCIKDKYGICDSEADKR
ncbi:hypothetical protein QNI16_21470 [Cytophagaceae bacterium YF14B1]|uniref:Uncharacterized protein n=1 Tax=Xanthocytophaga flava TaxID=3048013 RepID=A0AAE3QV44_9BACT|nr:hypothetical protein [Xanthocytophaga flavus]MDJ1483083.1 hypothetical protein [Xanthocytophaga flavus]